jgi:hypothetical protein
MYIGSELLRIRYVVSNGSVSPSDRDTLASKNCKERMLKSPAMGSWLKCFGN